MRSIYFIVVIISTVQSFSTNRDYNLNEDSNGYSSYSLSESPYIDVDQYQQSTSKPVYVPTYNKGYFENPANMYVSGFSNVQPAYENNAKYLQNNGGYKAEPVSGGYRVSSGYNVHDRFHPTTYEEKDPAKQPVASASQFSQFQVPAASQQFPTYAYQGGEAESHEGEVVESASNMDSTVQAYPVPALPPSQVPPAPVSPPQVLSDTSLMSYPYDASYYGGSGIDTNQIKLTEESKQAVGSQGFTYYYLGRKLWYIPLYFSIYFVAYVLALVLKAVARHKIQFPQSLQNVANMATRSLTQDNSNRIINMISDASNKYFMK